MANPAHPFSTNALAKILELWNLGVLGEFLGKSQNSVFVACRGTAEFYIRITEPTHRTQSQLLAEASFIALLNGNLSDHPTENSGLAVNPLHSVHGNLVEVIEADDFVASQNFPTSSPIYFVMVFPRAKGRPVDLGCNEEWSLALAEEWGKTLGRFHAVSALANDQSDVQSKLSPLCPHDQLSARPHWDLFDKEFSVPATLAHEEPLIANEYAEIVAKISSMPQESDVYGLVHGDLHPGNFFVEAPGLSVFDFDHCHHQFFVADVAFVFFIFAYEHAQGNISTSSKDFLDAFWKNYLQEFPSGESTRHLIPLFFRYRALVEFACQKQLRDDALATPKSGAATRLKRLERFLEWCRAAKFEVLFPKGI